MLVDLRSLAVSGQEAEGALDRVHITVNKNAIPYDPEPPRVTSGLRLGTPSITSRGFGVEESRQVARLIVKTLNNRGNLHVEERIRQEVDELTRHFPVPGLDF